jgi:hypothetical protein
MCLWWRWSSQFELDEFHRQKDGQAGVIKSDDHERNIFYG